MTDPISVLVVGLGGYGEVYLSALLDEEGKRRSTMVGAVDPDPGRCTRLGELEARGVPLFSSMEEFYRGGSSELAVISSPIQHHCEQACLALERGSHVLVEKPAAAVTRDVERMIRARDRAGRFVAVGFQWCFSPSILRLKEDILGGRFGEPRWGRSLTLWPRTEAYYGRNDWAGRRRDGEGRWILDSPANNAMAHHLHNLLFLLGPTMDRSAEPVGISAATARVNRIETFDTVAARVFLHGGTELLFLGSHTIAEEEAADPRFILEMEEATVTYPGGTAPMIARRGDDVLEEYPAPDTASQVAKLWRCVDAVRGGGAIPCGLEAARPQVACVEAIDASGTEPHWFSDEVLRVSGTSGGRLHWVEGLADALLASYQTGETLRWPGSEAAGLWAGLGEGL
ncbi:MAG: Gfo/Idh/MocA family oxidoreductase [Gemmatimonadota bacterium]|jgi:predicted dehydrogenase